MRSEKPRPYWDFCSSKATKPRQGALLATLYDTSMNDLQVPVNYRLYDKAEGKTKKQ